MHSRPTFGVSLVVAVVSFAAGCSRDIGLSSSVSIRAPLSSATSDVVLVQVRAEQGGETKSTTLESGSDTVTLELTVGEPALITGTVFTFDSTRWRSFSSTITVTPEVGSSVIDLTLVEAAGVTGSFTPTVTVHGEPSPLVDEPLVISIHDVDTDFTSTTPFVTDASLQLPAGRAVVFSVPDRFSGGTAERSLDTSAFAAGTEIALDADATIDIQGDDIATLTDSFADLDASDLGLECAVDGDCSSGNFAPCSASTVTLETERSYSVAVRYSKVPGSCETTKITRDLTPPDVATTFSPPFVQAGLASLTLIIDANEAIASDNVLLSTATDQHNRCTPTQVSAARVSCVVDLSGLDVTADVVFELDVSDVSGQHAVRSVTIHWRDASQTVQVVSVRSIPEHPDIGDGSALIGITLAAFDGQPLCGIGGTAYDFTGPTSATSFSTYYELPHGPGLVPATAAGEANLATYWTRMYLGSNATAAAYTMSGAVPVSSCGTRASVSPPLVASLTLIEQPVKWLSGGPLVLSPLSAGALSVFPFTGAIVDELSSSDESIVRVSFSRSEGASEIAGVKPGTARLTVTSRHTTTDVSAPASIDAIVVAPPDILALQQGRLVRRGRSGDTVTALPDEIGDVLRVFWESEREDIVIVGSTGVWIQDATGAVRVVSTPCGGESVLDATLTAAAPAHPSSQQDLALLVDAGTAARHCELDLTTLAQTVDVALDSRCSAEKIAADVLTGTYFAAGTQCAFTYEATATAATTLRIATYTSSYSADRLVLDARAALALVLSGDGVYGFDLIGGLSASRFNLNRRTDTTLWPTAIAIDPSTGVPMVAGYDQDGNLSTVFMAFTDRLGQGDAFVQIARTDPNASVPPTLLLFDSASNALYSSRPGNSYGAAASLLSFDVRNLSSYTSEDTNDYPIRAWPDGIEVLDMVIAGPQPTGLSSAQAAPGQSVTITGSGFNGGDRDEVFVQGIAAKVTASTRDSVTFVMPPELQTFVVNEHYAASLIVSVRSSGLLSGPVPMAVRDYGGDYTIELEEALPGTYIQTSVSWSSQLCDAPCSAGAVLVDALGDDGLFMFRPAADNPVIARFDTYYFEESIAGIGLASPVRVPGPRRLVGYNGDLLVEQWAGTFDVNSSVTQPFPQQRSASAHQTPRAVAASPDGRVLAVGDATGVTFHWATTFAEHPAGHVASGSVDRLTMTSKRLVVTSAGGTFAAVRFDDTQPAVVAMTADASACPTGARSTVLAMVPDASAADVLAVTLYPGPTVAVEAITDDGTNVSSRCTTYGSAPSSIVATQASRSGSRVVLLSGTTGYVYDTSDMRLPMDFATTSGTEGVLLTERSNDLFFYDVNTYYLQPLNQP